MKCGGHNGKPLQQYYLWEMYKSMEAKIIFIFRFHEANEIIAQISLCFHPFSFRFVVASRVHTHTHTHSPIRLIPKSVITFSYHPAGAAQRMIRKDQTRTTKRTNERTSKQNKKKIWYEFNPKMISCRLERKWRIFFSVPLAPFAPAPTSFFLFNIQFTWNRWIEYYYKVVKVYLIFCVLYFDADRRYACLCDVLSI